MEYPRLRWIDAHPFMNEGREMFIISDAEGIMENSLIVSKDILLIISLMDGSRSLRDIQADYMRIYGELLHMERLEEIVTAMDQSYLLFNENYKSRFADIKIEYEKDPVRRPALAGRSYPANRMDLLMALDEMFKAAPLGGQWGTGSNPCSPYRLHERHSCIPKNLSIFKAHKETPHCCFWYMS